jgi:hypothetical protein
MTVAIPLTSYSAWFSNGLKSKWGNEHSIQILVVGWEYKDYYSVYRDLLLQSTDNKDVQKVEDTCIYTIIFQYNMRVN